MSMPEFVIQAGIKRAWDFFKQNDYVIGYLLQELPINRQDEYREQLRTEDVAIHFGFPNTAPRMPSFSIVLKGDIEDREGQFINDDAADFREYPFPAVDNFAPFRNDPDFISRDKEEFGGVVYGDQDPKHGRTIGVDPDVGRGDVRKFSPRAKNLWQQRELGRFSDEQFDKMGFTQRLWHRDVQKLTSSAVGDRSTVDIIITTNNQEKTLVYYRLLRWVLRRWSTWFEVNGIMNIQYSGSDLKPNTNVVSDSITTFQRTLTMRYLHHDYGYEVEPVLAGFMLEIEMATRRPDGGLDIVKLIEWPDQGEDDENN